MTNIFISPHNKIAYIFLILTIILGVGIIIGGVTTSYGAEIIITPEPEDVDVNFQAFIIDGNTSSADPEAQTLSGALDETIQEAEETYNAKATVEMEDYAEGEIILTNDTFSPINFVPSTRFASPDGLIYRAINRIHIPAKGTITVNVRADKMGAAYNIESTTFTIPGLTSPSLIENISAHSEKPITGGLKKTGIIMQTDIDKAEKELYDKLYAKAVNEIEQSLPSANLTIVIVADELEKQTNVNAGEEKTEFNTLLKLKINAAAFSEKELLDLAVDKLKQKIPENKLLAAYDTNSLSYRLLSYDGKAGHAILDVQFRGYMVVDKNHEIFKKAQLKNLSKKQAANYLENFKEIKQADINLWPPLILKKTPNDINKIYIIIKSIN